MRSWLTRAAVATVVLVSADGALAQTPAAAAKPAATGKAWSLSRTPWGDPDLQAIWSTEDLRDIPDERPDQFGGRATLSDQEFAARQAQMERRRAALRAALPTRRRLRTFRQNR